MPSTTTPTENDPIHVMLVDDSAIVRGFIGRMLESDPAIKIVASVSNGEQGVSSAARHHPDVVILDIEMPVMDGITALPQILKASPGVKVIMCSTLTLRNAEITFKAFQLGATDCIAKPSNSSEIHGAADFKIDLLNRVKGLGKRSSTPARPISPSPSTPVNSASGTFSGGGNSALKQKTPFTLRQHLPGEIFRPNLLAIGSSTGGPQALFNVIKHFKDFDVPIIVTQHMPATFTKILAQHITQNTGVEALEGETGMKVERGKVYVAAGGHHMTFEKKGMDIQILLNEEPPENFCRPSVDPMLRSAIDIWGPKFLTLILTGMGQDGLEGSKLVVDGGGRVIAQDQETSVVWGMPGHVAIKGLCSAVLPLQDIGPYVRQKFGKA